MGLAIAILFLLGCHLMLLELCASQTTNTCSQYGDVRLVNGTGPHEGRVEICRSGIWKAVCTNSWNNPDARVVCAQLNYLPQDALAINGAAFGQGSGSTIKRIYCSGSECRITDCPISDYSPDSRCNHAGAQCLSCTTHGAVRLRGSFLEHKGRVEICVNGVWGTVCDDYWDDTDARVVCKQLGFSRFGSSGYRGAVYGAGRGPIHLDNVGCRGTEQRLIDCSYTNNTLGWDCTHQEDASVYCQTTLRCQEGALRLAGGAINYGGVEICVDETWGTICSTSWGQSEAIVACRQLGFSRLDASIWSTYGSGIGPVHYRTVVCTGRELRLSSCQRYRLISSCHGNKAGVYCPFDYLPSPMRLQVICQASNLCTLSWQRPSIYYTRQGTLLNYTVNCSTAINMHTGTRREDQILTYVTSSSTYTSVSLQPYQVYSCCVAAVNEAGRGNSSCQEIITHEAAPIAVPNDLEAHQLNSTSIFLSWRPPLIQYRNGIIRGYYVEFTLDNSTEIWAQYTTQDQHLLIDNLEPKIMYAYRVAAYTVGRGPFSEPLMIVLNSESEANGVQSTTTVTVATISTLLVAVIIMVGICFAVQIVYKLATRKKRYPSQVHNVHLYETVIDPKPTEKSLKERNLLSCTAEQNEHDYRDGSLTPPLPPRTYSLSSSLDKIDNLENLKDLSNDQELNNQPNDPQMDSENTYQPLIPPRSSINTTAASEYQSLTQLKHSEAKF